MVSYPYQIIHPEKLTKGKKKCVSLSKPASHVKIAPHNYLGIIHSIFEYMKKGIPHIQIVVIEEGTHPDN